MIDGLDDRFKHHPPSTQEVADTHIEVRRLLSELAGRIDSLVPDGREKSLAITKLEEAAMWANKAIALRNNERSV
jgi:hypothetical protein